MKKHYFLNPHSRGGSIVKNWPELRAHLTSPEAVFHENLPWGFENVAKGDLLISVGGDGTLHFLVNELIRQHGLSKLNEFGIGHIGLGSNNSYLQPLKAVPKIGRHPARTSNQLANRDLIEVRYQENQQIKIRYLVSNGSFGFLAEANRNFNTSSSTQVLKGLHSGLADVWAFLKTLRNFRPVHLNISEGVSIFYQGPITNFHIIKSQYFTKDLHFNDKAPADGQFDLFLLPSLKRFKILKKFIQMMMFQKMNAGFQSQWSQDRLQVSSEKPVFFELDGEIIESQSFDFICHPQSMKVCT